MKGSVRKRPSGKWSYYFDVGKSEDGKRRKKEKTGFKTKKEAQTALALALAEFENCGQAFTPPNTMSVSEYMYYWLNNYVKNSCRERTFETYKDIIDCHINKDLGHYYLKNLNSHALQLFFDKKFNDGYSKNLILGIYRVLAAALKHGINPYLFLKDNPAKYVNIKYKFEKKNELIITKETVYDVFKFVGERYPEYLICYKIGYMTGMRKSEVLGLTWDNVDLSNKVVHVKQQLLCNRDGTVKLAPVKTSTSNRSIAIGDSLVQELKMQKMKLDELNIKTNFVCVKDGNVITRNNIDYITKLIKDSGIQFNFHKLRHLHGSMLYEGGAAIKDISERLGHANCNTSLDIYVKNSDVIRRKTVDLFETML